MAIVQRMISDSFSVNENEGFDGGEHDLGVSIYNDQHTHASIVLTGSIETSTVWLFEEELKALQDDNTIIVISFEHVDYVCPEAVRAIRETKNTLKNKGGNIILCGTNSALNVFTFLPVLEPVITFPTLKKAEEYLFCVS